MAETTMRGPKWYRYNYTAYDKSKIPAAGELRFFNTILTGITHPCSVIGDGATAVSGLPFREIINIQTNANISLEVLRVAGNIVLIKNTKVSSITVNLGTAGVPVNYTLIAGATMMFKFTTSWEGLINYLDFLYVAREIGIGIATPTADLHLLSGGDIKWGSSSHMKYAVGHGDMWASATWISLIFESDGGGGPLRIMTGNPDPSLATELVRVTYNGKVGIGTPTPTLMFSVTEKTGFSPLGGTCIKVTNKTGGNTVAGRLVKTSTANDDSVVYTAIGDTECIGVFLESGIADGSEAWVVVGGIADVMLDDNVAAVHGNWMGTGAGAGYARTQASPAAAPQHFEEIGHCLESVAATGAGTHILARCVLHFL